MGFRRVEQWKAERGGDWEKVSEICRVPFEFQLSTDQHKHVRNYWNLGNRIRDNNPCAGNSDHVYQFSIKPHISYLNLRTQFCE